MLLFALFLFWFYFIKKCYVSFLNKETQQRPLPAVSTFCCLLVLVKHEGLIIKVPKPEDKNATGVQLAILREIPSPLDGIILHWKTLSQVHMLEELKCFVSFKIP